MSKITDYSFLFHSMFGTKSTKGASAIGSFQLSQLNSSSVQAQLRAAGIDTNSKQYKAAIKQMMSNANGAMYGNIQGIKNLMKSYDKDGDYIDPTTGLAGLLVTEENEGSRKRIITIPESSKDEMFEQTKKEFLRENGVLNGDTTKRSDVYTNMYHKVQKNDRLAGQDILCSSMSVHIGRRSWMPQEKLIQSGRLESQFRLGYWMALQESLLKVHLQIGGSRFVKKSIDVSI